MAYYIKKPGQTYFYKEFGSIEEARLGAIRNWEGFKIKLRTDGLYKTVPGVPVFSSLGSKKPYGFVVGADAFYWVTEKKNGLSVRKILKTGKLKK